MCCAFLILIFLGPRIFGIFWWIFQPVRWQTAFNSWPVAYWIWPILGIIFLPWTTIMYILVAPGGVTGWDWFWIGLMVVADIMTHSSGFGRKRLPGYEGY